MNIAVIGCWHQGVVGAACLADAGHIVTGFTSDANVLSKLKRSEPPLFEPGLDDLLGNVMRAGRLSFTGDAAAAVHDCAVAMVMHDTPVDENDRSDLSGIFSDITSMSAGLRRDAVVYVTAQVPVGTCDEIIAIIRAANPSWQGGIAYSPENLRLGQAIERFRVPPLPVVGTDNEQTKQRMSELLSTFPVEWRYVNVRTAEMAKHALNSFLALSICFANEIGNLCDLLGADGYKLAEVLRLEPRIGAKAMLFPGLGFAGGTLARDMQTLRSFGDALGVETALLDGAWASNKSQNLIVVHTLSRLLGGNLAGRKIAVLGLTYKPDTSTLRRSAALEVIASLVAGGAVVRAHDPRADRSELSRIGGFSCCDSPLEAAQGCEALILMTPWKEYSSIDPAEVKKAMTGRIIFDTANIWPSNRWEREGLVHLTIGRGKRMPS